LHLLQRGSPIEPIADALEPREQRREGLLRRFAERRVQAAPERPEFLRVRLFADREPSDVHHRFEDQVARQRWLELTTNAR
jgi:hypothetical protein